LRKRQDIVISDFTHGVYIINEGFHASNGSISYFDPLAAITNGILWQQTSVRWGCSSVVAVVGDTAGFIVVNGSGKVEFVRLKFQGYIGIVPVVYRDISAVTGQRMLSAGSMGQDLCICLHTGNNGLDYGQEWPGPCQAEQHVLWPTAGDGL
jgi:hypothetical protein